MSCIRRGHPVRARINSGPPNENWSSLTSENWLIVTLVHRVYIQGFSLVANLTRYMGDQRMVGPRKSFFMYGVDGARGQDAGARSNSRKVAGKELEGTGIVERVKF